jgi:hypothetical protein
MADSSLQIQKLLIIERYRISQNNINFLGQCHWGLEMLVLFGRINGGRTKNILHPGEV